MKVLNRKAFQGKALPENARYIGRGTPFGNPYAIGQDGTREEVIDKFRGDLEAALRRGDNDELVRALRGLREDTDLVCSCAPAACHGDVIKEIWEREFKDKPLVFVFGSNLAGRHGKGAAEYARKHFGATPGVGEGPQGSAYGIPTKDERLKIRTTEAIGKSVHRFLDYARAHPETDFFVTAIGCGLAGYRPEHIAPLFASAPSNCLLPEGWRIELPRPVRVVVAGGRGFRDAALLDERMRVFFARLGLENVAVISGEAPGADTLGAEWARKNGIPVMAYPANWSDCSAPDAARRTRGDGQAYDARAGHRRNLHMAMAATHGVCFWDGKSPGTRNMIGLLEQFNIPHRVVRY